MTQSAEGGALSPADRLRQLLEARGLPWPAPLEHLDVVGSTNDWLRERAREAAPEWSAVLADRQTAGRGRQGRAWVSPEGNLFLSVLLRPIWSAERAVLIPLAAGVAAAEAAQELGVEARLKWPNDLVVDDRKLGGILVEATGGEELDWAVVGVGLNLNLDPHGLPPELRDTVTSVRAQTGRTVEAADAAAAVLARLRLWYDALAREGPARVLTAWRGRSVPWWGRLVEARAGDTALRGTARGLDERGALLLDLEDGSRVAVVSGEVRELRLAAPRSGA